MFRFLNSEIASGFVMDAPLQYFPADAFPTIHPVHWLTSHFAVGGWSPLQRLSGMLTAHMTQIAPRNGFTWHPHRGLEIYTWVLEGELYHEDTTGGKGIIRAGELQRMFAGDYIEHQELNLSDSTARVIQIWYVADRRYQGLEPHYQQVGRDALPSMTKNGVTTYSLIGSESPMHSHIQGRLTATVVQADGETQIALPEHDSGEDLFLYVTDGSGVLEYEGIQVPLGQYDVILARSDAGEAIIRGKTGSNSLHYLSFYLPNFL